MGYTVAPYLFALLNLTHAASAFMKHNGWLLVPEASRMILVVHVIITLPAVMISAFWFWYASRAGDVGGNVWKISLVGLLIPVLSEFGLPSVDSYYSDIAGFVVALGLMGILVSCFIQDVKQRRTSGA